MKTATRGVVALAAALALGLSACQPGAGGQNPAPQPTTDNTQLAAAPAEYNPQPRDNVQDGGTLTTGLVEVSAQFNTFQADGTAYTLTAWKWYNPILALYGPDGEWSFNDDYLTDVTSEEVDGNTVVTYTIVDEAVFNDGTPIDWTAFEATWKANSGQNEAYLASSTDGYSSIKSVTQGENAKQAVVTFNGAWAWWQGQFNYVLHPKAAADPETYNQAYVNNPHNEWGAGPYQVKSYDQNAGTLVFERNPKWWGDAGKLDERIFRQLEDQADLNAFKAGQIDATGASTKDRLTQVEAMPDVEIRRSATPANNLVVLNNASPILADPKVRQATMQMIDRETVLKVRYDGMNYTEELPGSFTLYPWQEGYKDNLAEAGITFDVAAANTLLDEAGWTEKDAEGFRTKEGKVLELQFPVLGDAPTTTARALAIQAMAKAAGIKMTIVNKPSSEFSNVFTEKQFDFFLMGFSSSDPFGQAYFCQVYCEPSSLNASGSGNEEINAQIEEATKIADPTEQTNRLNEIEVEAFKTFGIMPLYNGPTIVAVKAGLANYGAGLFYVGKPQDIGWQK